MALLYASARRASAAEKRERGNLPKWLRRG
jgi:hypothetical protein